MTPRLLRVERKLLGHASVKRVGLLGGSFNPAHRGHRRISLAAMRALGLDEVWWLVSPGNPLKDDASDMAPLKARAASAVVMARRAPIRVSAIESEFGTRYTVDTLRKLVARFPQQRFVWLMGADNLEDFHQWRDWREIAALVPIAVIGRPGYEGPTQAVRAMGWLRRCVHRPGLAKQWTLWSLPALLILRLPPDPSSATAIRMADPDWYRSDFPQAMRDMVTHRRIR